MANIVPWGMQLIPGFQTQGLLGGPQAVGTNVVPGMKEVAGERVMPKGLPAPAEQAAKAVTKGGGLLGGLGALTAAADGVSQLNEAFNPMVRIPKIQEAMDQERTRNTREHGQAWKNAQAYGDPQGVAQRAVGNAMGDVEVGANEYKQQAAQGKFPINLMADQSQVNRKAPQVEVTRQRVEAGAMERLRTNQLSRPKAAEEVVKADQQRTGNQYTPQEFKARVAEETTAMKGMDDNQLSKYLSYALVAGGLIASALDKSGNAGKAFAGGFNAQIDRRQEMAKYEAQQKAAAKAAADKAAIEERKIGIQERDVASKEKSREDASELGQARYNLSRDELEAKREKWANDATRADAKLAAYERRTASGKSGKTQQGSPISQKENIELVDSYFGAKGIKLGEGVKESMASELRQLQKNNPNGSASQYLDYLSNRYQKNQSSPKFFGLMDSGPELVIPGVK